MKSNKICFNKSVGILVAVVILLGFFSFVASMLSQQITSTNTRAEFNNNVYITPTKSPKRCMANNVDRNYLYMSMDMCENAGWNECIVCTDHLSPDKNKTRYQPIQNATQAFLTQKVTPTKSASNNTISVTPKKTPTPSKNNAILVIDEIITSLNISNDQKNLLDEYSFTPLSDKQIYSLDVDVQLKFYTNNVSISNAGVIPLSFSYIENANQYSVSNSLTIYTGNNSLDQWGGFDNIRMALSYPSTYPTAHPDYKIESERYINISSFISYNAKLEERMKKIVPNMKCDDASKIYKFPIETKFLVC